MDRRNRKSNASDDLRQRGSGEWVSPLLRNPKRSLPQSDSSDSSSSDEPTRKRARPNVARQPSARRSDPIEVIEIIDSDDSDEDENDTAQQVVPAETTRSRSKADNRTSLSSKAKDTVETNSSRANKKKDYDDTSDSDTALSREERMESRVANSALDNEADSDISVSRNAKAAIEPASTGTARSRSKADNRTSSSRKTKDTVERIISSARANKKNDYDTFDTDTALSREERMESPVANSAQNNKSDSNISVSRHAKEAIKPASTGTARSRNKRDTVESLIQEPARSREDKENDTCLAGKDKTDTDAFLADDDVYDHDTSLADSLENNKDNDTAFFQTHCWICHVELVSEDDQVFCYAMHTHPVLNTPVCSLCYEVVENVVREHSACAGCGEETDTSFVCDNIIEGLLCQNEFCFECVEKAGLDVSVLQTSKDEWHCLACNPTLTLQALCTSDNSLPSISERTTEDILQELEVAEEKKRECEEALEDANVQLKSQEILLELNDTVPESDLEEAVQEELTEWHELQMRHEARLGDFISKLQDELETRGIDMATVYHSNDCLSMPTLTLPDVSPQWVETAARANEQRKEEEKDFPVKPILPAAEYKKDYTDDVIEIAEMDAVSDLVGCRGSGWVNSAYKPTLVEIREAQKEEDEERARRKLSKNVTRRTDTRDKATMKDEGPRIRNKNGRMVVERTRRQARTPSGKIAASPSRASKQAIRSRPEHAVSLKEPVLLSQNSEVISTSELDGPFIESDYLLCTPKSREASSCGLSSEGVVRRVSIAKGFVRILKEHQKDGVRFIWRNSFCDFEKHFNGNENDERVGGCILAHHMGLGKTLTTIASLHSVLTSPAMISPNNEKTLRTVVLVVPVNTIANWKDEFTKWFDYVSPKVHVYTPSDMNLSERKALISKWMKTGGIFLVSSKSLLNLAVDNGDGTDLLRANILVIDEAHTMIKNSSTKIFKILSKFETKRRVLLSGSPFQNNLLEYYQICNFIRNGVFGVQSLFKEKFLTPISQGQAKDSTQRQKALTAALSDDLRRLVDSHIHRRDVSILEQDLPKLSQVVIHIRPSHVQSKIYRTFEQARNRNSELRNFFKMHSELSPVHNHPSCLLTKYSDSSSSHLWCGKHISPEAEAAKLGEVTGGNKIVLLLHLLAFAEVLGEKVLIFSQYLPTLDYIESVLSSDDWISQVPSLSCFSGQRLGGWEKGRHYLRLDGSNSSIERGQSINAFNEDGDDGDLRAFLISSVAGSLGINLTSASRVVLVDSHFNPTVMTQAVCRAYRFGQQKPVHCYRLLTEGTMEEKIYARSVNKTGLALRLIDSKSIKEVFSAKELDDFQQFDTWVQCDQCEKWRMLTGTSAEDLPEKWFCEMNTDDHNNRCDLPERDQAWYLNVYKNGFPASPQKQKAEPDQPKCQPEEEDELLSHLISISESKKGTSLISRHYYHDSLLKSSHDGEEVEHARILLANESTAKDQSNAESQVPCGTNPVETGQSLASLLADEAAAKEESIKELQASISADLVEVGPSLAPPSASKAATKDESRNESDASSAANSIESGPPPAPASIPSSNITGVEARSSKKEQDESEKTDAAAKFSNEIPVRKSLSNARPVRQSLSSQQAIIDLCDSSDDEV